MDAAFREPGILIVEGEYTTGAQEHLYIENNGAIAAYSETEGVTFWGSLQCPFYAHKALMAVTGLPEDKVRVIQVETGGAFGGKEDYPSMIGAHAALLAMKSGRPVKIIYDRMEDMAATTKRHPSRARHRTAVTKDGKLLAADIEFCLDGGAYSTLSSTVLSRGHDSLGRRVLLAEYPRAVEGLCDQHAAARGVSRIRRAPGLFATERHMDRVAKAVGLTPEEFRRRNLLRTGETTSTGQEIHQQIDLPGWMERALTPCRVLRKEGPVRSPEPGQSAQEGYRVRRFPSRRGIYRLGRALPQFAGWRRCDCGWSHPRACVEHGVWARHEYDSLPDRS